eukprot:TRINITY_DN27010_c0_g1_i1.p1 TRINITY_DN27010_c0_g1~~TRINITY_DN27010_c0_g1_i1.p1  ORF type:complete len:264 (+),score=55.89 TRINITY_DN27010_c0_g1_i1:117-794(+)
MEAPQQFMSVGFERLYQALRFGRAFGRPQKKEVDKLVRPPSRERRSHDMARKLQEKVYRTTRYQARCSPDLSPLSRPQATVASVAKVQPVALAASRSVQIDSDTTIPYDLYKDLVVAGRRARQRGQHELYEVPANREDVQSGSFAAAVVRIDADGEAEAPAPPKPRRRFALRLASLTRLATEKQKQSRLPHLATTAEAAPAAGVSSVTALPALPLSDRRSPCNFV